MSVAASQINIEQALNIGGWMSERELRWLAAQASRHNRIVEFGSFHGRSTRALADNSPTCAKIWAVDPWNGAYKMEDGRTFDEVNTFIMPYFCQNLQDHIARGRVIPTRNWSYNFNTDEPIDMVFIDGDHRYETVKKDIKTATSLLVNGGLLCGHDWDHPTWPGVRKAVTELVGKVDVEDTIWWTIIHKF